MDPGACHVLAARGCMESLITQAIEIIEENGGRDGSKD
jgi:hypothetical protein